ncbi:MAG: hypothetical protein AAFU85_27725 [Planctomycetota bacterium]
MLALERPPDRSYAESVRPPDPARERKPAPKSPMLSDRLAIWLFGGYMVSLALLWWWIGG